jgi:hypothetical protein
MTWELILKEESSKVYIDNAIQELKEEFITLIRERNPNVSDEIILQTANKELIAYVKNIIFEGKEIPIPSLTQFGGNK